MADQLLRVHAPGGDIDALDDWTISEIVGEFNTEAKCAALLAVPEDGTLVSMAQVRENLDAFGGFDFENPDRFNVLGILKETRDRFVSLHRDPAGPNNRNTYWVGMRDTELGSFGRSVAGNLLYFSLANNMPLRKILGERRRSPDGTKADAIETRLAVLAVLAYKHTEASGKSFAYDEVEDQIADQFTISPVAIKKHLAKLRKAGLVSEARQGNNRLELPKLPDGRESIEIIMNLLRLVGGTATGLSTTYHQGIEKGREIMTDAGVLPLLIRRSYASSTHTGKHTPHSS